MITPDDFDDLMDQQDDILRELEQVLTKYTAAPCILVLAECLSVGCVLANTPKEKFMRICELAYEDAVEKVARFNE